MAVTEEDGQYLQMDGRQKPRRGSPAFRYLWTKGQDSTINVRGKFYPQDIQAAMIFMWREDWIVYQAGRNLAMFAGKGKVARHVKST
jgi:hypothetical protein